MQLRTLVLALCVAIQLAYAAPVLAYQSPGTPTGFVNDFAGVMSARALNEIEAELSAFAASSTTEVVVVTITSLDGDYIEHAAEQLFEEWGIGKKETDNGVLLLLAIEDRSLRIEVGYGLEGALPDSVSDRIVREMVPLLKESRYDEAILRGVQDIQNAVRGEYTAEADARTANEYFNLGVTALIFGSFVLQWVGAVLARSKSWWVGGVLGLVVGVIASSSLTLWVAGGLLLTAGLTLFGLFFDYIVSSTYQHAEKNNIDPPWWAGGSGYGGSSSAGGFGGFGGGRSGGGGASGRW